MRLGLVIYGSPDTLSGGYLYDRHLVEHLRACGDSVEIISMPPRSYFEHLGDNLSTAWLEELCGLWLDALLEDELNHPSLFLLNRRLKRRVRYPILSIVHHLRSSELRPAWQNLFYRQIERSYLSSVDGFIYNSQTTRQAVGRLVGEKKPGVVAYPAGDRFGAALEEAEIAARCRQPGPLRVLFLGNLIPRKGLHTLIEALRLAGDRVRLVVAGRLDADPSYAAQVRRQAGSLGKRVEFTGPVVEENLGRLLRSSHLLAVPSSYEGFGIVYLEGMASGLPALATTAGAAKEIITPGANGWLVEPGAVEAIAGILREAARDREGLLRLSLGARARFLAHPGWSDSMDRARRFILDQVEQTK